VTAIDEQGAAAARAMIPRPRALSNRHRVEFAAHIDDSCTCPRTACGGVLVAPEVETCPWHDLGEALDWAAQYHRAGDCPDLDEPVSACTGIGCSECMQLGCDRDYGDD
jgi:hypothetical protein